MAKSGVKVRKSGEKLAKSWKQWGIVGKIAKSGKIGVNSGEKLETPEEIVAKSFVLKSCKKVEIVGKSGEKWGKAAKSGKKCGKLEKVGKCGKKWRKVARCGYM